MDVVIGLVQALSADPGVSAIAGANVFDFELPQTAEMSGQMPEPAVVIRPHGGPAGPDMLYVNDTRMQVYCYQSTPHLAYVLYNAVYVAFKNWRPAVWAGTYIHYVNPAAGPIPFRDASSSLQYAYNVSSWLVRASDETIE